MQPVSSPSFCSCLRAANSVVRSFLLSQRNAWTQFNWESNLDALDFDGFEPSHAGRELGMNSMVWELFLFDQVHRCSSELIWQIPVLSVGEHSFGYSAHEGIMLALFLGYGNQKIYSWNQSHGNNFFVCFFNRNFTWNHALWKFKRNCHGNDWLVKFRDRMWYQLRFHWRTSFGVPLAPDVF